MKTTNHSNKALKPVFNVMNPHQVFRLKDTAGGELIVYMRDCKITEEDDGDTSYTITVVGYKSVSHMT